MRLIKNSLLTISVLLLAAVVIGCSSRFVPKEEKSATPSPSVAHLPTNGLIQSNTEGSVTIDVKWAVAESNSLTFDVVMDTHSVDLDQYDLSKLAILRDDKGNEYRPSFWKSAPGGHHRQGKLTFPSLDAVKEGQIKYVEMVIRNVAGIKERVLRWEL